MKNEQPPSFLVVASNKDNTYLENIFSSYDKSYTKEVLSYPVYHFNPLRQFEQMWFESQIQAMIITSTYSLNALQQSSLIKLDSFKATPLFLSGEETQKVSKKMGFKNSVSYAKWGLRTIENELMIKDQYYNILYFHGDPYTKLTQNFLNKKRVLSCMLYSMVFKSKISCKATDLLFKKQIRYIIFLSQSTLEVFHQKMKKNLDVLGSITAICLSEKIQNNLKQRSLYKEIVLCDTFDKMGSYISSVS